MNERENGNTPLLAAIAERFDGKYVEDITSPAEYDIYQGLLDGGWVFATVTGVVRMADKAVREFQYSIRRTS